MRAIILAAVACVAFAGPLSAGQADCRDYANASGEDRSLFDGYIFGYVSALLKGVSSKTEINAVTMLVKRETDKYCIIQPADDPNKVIELFAEAETYKLRRRR